MSDERMQVYFYGGEDDSAPNSQNGSLACKFLLVSSDDCLYLLFGPLAEFPYHAGLLDRFCKEQQIASSWVKRPDLLEIFDENCEVRGGGYLEFDQVLRTVCVSGQSTAYGGFRQREINRILSGHPMFSEFTWTVE